MRSILYSIAIACAAPGALAQQGPEPPDRYAPALRTCTAVQQQGGPNPETVIAECEAAIIKLDAVHAQPPMPSPHEENLHHFGRGIAYAFIAGAYNKIDRARSARVCDVTEKAWAD